jgi:hypothetical protein
MRRLLLALSAMLLCAACPQPRPATNAPAEQARPAEQRAPSARPAESGTPATDPMARFNLGGVYFGMTPQQFAGLFPQGGLLKTEITELKSFGVHEIVVKPADGSKDRDMYAAFVDNALVHFTRREPLDDQQYDEQTSDLAKKYGRPGAVPPDFCAGNPYFKGFSAQSKQFAKVMFWSDTDTLSVLSAMTWPEKKEMHFLLFNPRLYELLSVRMSQASQPPK